MRGRSSLLQLVVILAAGKGHRLQITALTQLLLLQRRGQRRFLPLLPRRVQVLNRFVDTLLIALTAADLHS